MRLFRDSRWILLALALVLVPASSFAGVFISVAVAPPVLPVYEQPPCPQPGWMWTPGYWAYGPDGYYWVPGSWVPAPYEGALWTPPYWGWFGGSYVFHPGYWGHHVGYYGGVNYGFGYMGVGFVGGLWHGHNFVYNTAVVHVNRTIIHNTYIDRTIVERNTIVNNRHVAYSGGPGGIRHEASNEERTWTHEHHDAPTRIQEQHFQAARADHASYAKFNGGHPQNYAVERPMGGNRNGGPADIRHEQGNGAHNAPNYQPRGNAMPHNAHVSGGGPEGHPVQGGHVQFDQRPAPQHQMESHNQQRPEAHSAPQHESHQSAPHEQQGKPEHGHGKGH